MNITHIKDVLVMDDGLPVMAVCGIVESVFKQNTGTSDLGDWAIQNISLQQSGHTVKVKIKDRPAFAQSVKGQKMYIESAKDKRGQWRGITVKDDDYRGKVSKILNVTPMAVITLMEATCPTPNQTGEVEATAPAQPTAPVAPAKASAKQQPEQTMSEPVALAKAKEEGYRVAVRELRHGLAAAANAYWLCLVAGEHVFKRYGEHFGEPMTAEQFQAMVSSMYIWCDRRGLVDGIPHGDLTPYMPTKKAEAPGATKPTTIK